MALSHKEAAYEAVRDILAPVPKNDEDQFREYIEGALEALEDMVVEYYETDITLSDIISG